MRLPTRIQCLALIGASLLPLASAVPALALSVSVGGSHYDVFYTTTSHTSNPDLFGATPPGQMPWWGDASLASTFAAEVFDQLGLDLFQTGYGAVFAYAYNAAGLGEINGIVQNTSDINDQLDFDASSPLAASAMYPYAYAALSTSVPSPLPLLGAAAAVGWARKIRRRATTLQTCGAQG